MTIRCLLWDFGDTLCDERFIWGNGPDFFAFTYAFFRAGHLPQGIVTVNPDLFSEVIVPAHDLASVCDTIVTSWEERTTDKAILCQLAIERIGDGFQPGESLLIDNKQANIDAWTAEGGVGYRYRTDADFQHDIESGKLGIEP